jgi:6-phosphogluconolactonase
MNHRATLVKFAVLIVSLAALPAMAGDLVVLFGSQVPGPDKGFSIAHFDTETGALTRPELLLAAQSPVYFVIHPDGKHLYTCNSIGKTQDQPGGGVSAYSIDPKTAHLTFINQKNTGGIGPAYVSVDHTGRFCLIANYGAGSVSVFAIEPDGSLGARTAFDQHTGSSVNPDRQKAPHAHSIRLDLSNRFALVPDLGVDKVYIYRFNSDDGSLAPNDPPFAALPPGSGPRHIAFHPNGKLIYVSNEIANTVAAFAWDSDKGQMTELQTISSLPADYKGSDTCAEIGVRPDGKFLYVSNRGSDTVGVFSIDDSGRLTPVQQIPTQGKVPRNFELDPSGKWIILTNQMGDTTVVYRIDEASGRLTQVGDPIPIKNPFCPRFFELHPD